MSKASALVPLSWLQSPKRVAKLTGVSSLEDCCSRPLTAPKELLLHSTLADSCLKRENVLLLLTIDLSANWLSGAAAP